MLLMLSTPAPAILITGLVAVALGSPPHLSARSLITFLALPNQVGVRFVCFFGRSTVRGYINCWAITC
jgi:hypothetical protein